MNHFLLIPDGDRRFAIKKKISNLEAYRIAGKTLRRIIANVLVDHQVKEMSFFGLSYSNIVKRCEEDLDVIINSQIETLNDFAQDQFFANNSIKIKVCGERTVLSKKYLEAIKQCEAATSNNQEKILNLLIAYSGTKDYEQAIKKTVTENKPLLHANIVKNCMVQTPIDFMLRTAGEQRISDGPVFLIQYTEYGTVKNLFPELNKKDINSAFKDFNNRKRTFGV